MAKRKKEEETEDQKKRTYLSQADVPSHPLEQARRISTAIFENYGSRPTTPLRVASAMNVQPSSGPFRSLCGASIAYGLTDGGYNAPEISLTPLATRILKPLKEEDDLAAKREAFMKPRAINEFMTKYNGSPLPKDNIAQNVLNDMGIPMDKTSQVLALIIEGAEALGLITEIKGRKYVELTGTTLKEDVLPEGENKSIEEKDKIDKKTSDKLQDLSEGKTLKESIANKKVFITHGKNKVLVDPIKKLLHFGELEPIVSVERQSVSQPVPEKVMEDMRSCGAAIIHVEDELRLRDQEAKEHVILNPNVLIEIGAAMALYGKKFILLVKEGVRLPSNLQGLYEVRYTGDTLDGDATIKLLEAINELKKIKSKT